MIKARKGHTTIRGNAGEIFDELRAVLAGVREGLVDQLDVEGAERFIENAVLSSRTEAWNKALDESKSKEEVFEVLSEVNSTLKKALALLKAKDDERGCECCECKEACE